MARSLAEEIAKLANPTPLDYDPEDLERQQNSDASSDSEAENASRAHYVDVGRSKLRSDGPKVDEKKYGGSRVSRKDLDDRNSPDASEQSEDDSEENIEDSEISEDEDEDEDEEKESDSEESGAEISESEESDAEEIEDEATVKGSSGPASSVAEILKQEQKQLVSRLSASVQQDVEKGRAIASQMAVYEKLLDLRIRLQKVVTLSNGLLAENSSHADELDARGKLHGLIGEIAELRREVAASDNIDYSEVPSSSSNKKRSFEDFSQEAQAMDVELAGQREKVLTKWSRKVQLASGNAALQTQKFKSLNQSAAVQVTSVLADMPRLKARTQLNRSNYKIKGEVVEESELLFDDSDFYRLLLKELVDRRMADSGSAQGLKWTAAKTKTKKSVDTKASKGRKLRYHVQEKVQGFDAPRSIFKWSDEQIDDLFASLLGQSITMDDAEPQEVEEDVVPEEFALFG